MRTNLAPAPISEGTTPSLTPYQFSRLCISGKVVDGRAGGLIIGKTLDRGGIIPIFKLGSRYIVQGRIESDTFAVNWKAATQNLSRLKAMNSGLTLREDVDQSEGEPGVAHFIITHGTPDDRLIYLHWGQVIVNREATAKHLAELVEMNVWPNPYCECDLREVLGWDGTTDGIILIRPVTKEERGRLLRERYRKVAIGGGAPLQDSNQWAVAMVSTAPTAPVVKELVRKDEKRQMARRAKEQSGRKSARKGSVHQVLYNPFSLNLAEECPKWVQISDEELKERGLTVAPNRNEGVASASVRNYWDRGTATGAVCVGRW